MLQLQAGGFVPDMFSVVGGIVSATLSITKHYLNKQQREEQGQRQQQQSIEGLDSEESSSPYGYLSSLATATRVLKGISLARKEEMENRRQFIR